MKIVLATGIYPPDIGGPATYAAHLAQEFTQRGHDVVVIAYEPLFGRRREELPWPVISIPRHERMRDRWRAYADALQAHAKDADVVEAFSSVSCGIPLRMAKLKKPKKILRLGGDFLWERYTDRGGMKGLREWYASWHWMNRLGRPWMKNILRSFDALVFSTMFQNDLYEKAFSSLPPVRVIENAVPDGLPVTHERHDPLRLLYMGRFVGFKNLQVLLRAMKKLPHATLTLTGEGPFSIPLINLVSSLGLNDRVTFLSPVHGPAKEELFARHDALIIPSVTEISPNSALEARSRGLPVLLTKETGLSDSFTDGMMVRELKTEDDIVRAVTALMQSYDDIARASRQPFKGRTWSRVADDHLALFNDHS